MTIGRVIDDINQRGRHCIKWIIGQLVRANFIHFLIFQPIKKILISSLAEAAICQWFDKRSRAIKQLLHRITTVDQLLESVSFEMFLFIASLDRLE